MFKIKNLINRSITIYEKRIKPGQEEPFDINMDKYLRNLEKHKVISITKVLEVPVVEPIIVPQLEEVIVEEKPIVEPIPEVIIKPKRIRKKKEKIL